MATKEEEVRKAKAEEVTVEEKAPEQEVNSEPESPKQWQCGDPYQYPITGNGDHWEKLLEPLLEKDRVQCDSWKDEVQNLLIFAGLFSAVLSAFVVVSYPTLQPDQNEVMIGLLAHIATRLDTPLAGNSSSISSQINIASLSSPPSASSIRVNVFWFISLVLSLTTALIGIVSLQWLREHLNYPSTLPPREKFAMFNMRAEALSAWHVPEIFSSLPLLLQLSLALFFVGLIDFLLAASWKVAIPVTIFITVPFIFLIYTTTVPALQMFIFCLPLSDRVHRVPQQAPYKSTQSRLFRRLVTLSRHVFMAFTCISRALYSVNHFWHSLLHKSRHPRRDTPETATIFGQFEEPQRIADDILDTLESSSWLSFDKEWLVLRDAYARSIFQKEWCMTSLNRFRSRKSAPFYDLTRGVSTAALEYTKTNPTALCSGYLSVEEMTSMVLSDLVSSRSSSTIRSNNAYLQTLMIFGDLRNPPSTFCSLFDHPSAEFMRDENMFIFLTQYAHPPPFILRHSAELHVRIVNCLYPKDNRQPIQNSLADFPSYPDLQLFICYSKGIREQAEYGACFEGAISEQFSYFWKTYLEALANPDIDTEALLMSLYGHQMGEIVKYAAFRQPLEKVASSLCFLSTSLKDSMTRGDRKRSDLLFYVSACYASLLSWEPPVAPLQRDDHVRAFVSFLPILRQYLEARGTPDEDLRERLSIPDTSDQWWEFLNQDSPENFFDWKGLPNEGADINTSNVFSISPPEVPEVLQDVLDKNDISKLDLHADDLV